MIEISVVTFIIIVFLLIKKRPKDIVEEVDSHPLMISYWKNKEINHGKDSTAT